MPSRGGDGKNDFGGTPFDMKREEDLQIKLNQLWKHFKNLVRVLLLMEIPLKAVWTPDKYLSKGFYMLHCEEINLHFTSKVRTFFAYLQRVV